MIKFSFALTSALLLVGVALPAGASLVGDTVTCTATSPFPLICNPTTAEISDGDEVEFSLQDESAIVLDLLDVDAGDDMVRLENVLTEFFIPFFPGESVTLSDLDWVDDPLAVLTGIRNFTTTASGAEASDITFGPDSVTIDLSGMEFDPGDFLSFELVTRSPGTAVIPLPATAVLLLGGVAVIGFVGRRRAD